MRLSASDINDLEKRYRAALINSLSGFKPANLIGTANAQGQTNLAVISSVVHLGSNPPLFGMVQRPPVVPRHTYENILETGVYTVNHIHETIHEQAHQTSARFARDESEFDATGLTPSFVDGFAAPFVAESKIRFGMRLVRDVAIEENGTRFLIGKVEWIDIAEELLAEDGYLNIEKAGSLAITGLDGYHRSEMIGRLPYAKKDQPLQRLEDPMKGFK